MTEVEAQHKIDNLEKIIELEKDEREGLAKDKEELLKKLSDSLLDLRKLKHEKEILLTELADEIRKRIDLQTKLFIIEEDSKNLPF